ncbi:5-oxoprolinase [Kordiimonas sediminis]|uniref:5-oxoprolinase n=1 Tax=Kordiimonas sediminis TaxID=1735581 RepID=A0A919E4X7_9PROT|nr:hydantoinase/oxoprolinase family protein [Kordiimonas sediminis]GHF14054.1 5-oxoprolinase [Kordiimonas sediminis]
MGYTLDIDTGGTFTDGFVVHDGDARLVKVPTTPHDLTICFQETIAAAAEVFGVSVEDFLSEADIIRFSNTIGTNTIIQRDGSKIGLLLSKGMKSLAPTGGDDGKAPLVDPEMVMEIAETTDEAGKATKAPDATEVLKAVQELVDRGARGIVVSFENSHLNAENEQAVRRIIKAEYPRDYLGSVSSFLSSDITARAGSRERLNSAVLNAYIHAKLARLLYKAGEDLRQKGYRKTLFIGHNNASVARVAKTRAINTYNSGPAAGLLGAREIGALYGYDNLISTDMGGTSYDIGYVKDGLASYALQPDVEGFPCNLPMMAIRALGTGGGSIARVEGGAVKVGPQSSGALPGPACFNLGGSKPTVTDANLVLGVLDPDFFLGGTMKLYADKAREVIERDIAGPLGITVEEAAQKILDTVNREMGRAVADVATNFDADAAPVVIAYGGAGGLHACGIAAEAGTPKVIMTPFSSVSSAYSSSLMDVGHVYYARAGVALDEKIDADLLDKLVSKSWQEAVRDMRGEGFGEDALTGELQLFVKSKGGDKEVLIPAPLGFYKDNAALDVVLKLAQETLAAEGENPDAALSLETLAVRVSAEISHYVTSEMPVTADDPAQAVKAHRPLYIASKSSFADVPVYDRDKLGCGAAISGPAIVESDKTSILVPEGWKMTLDTFNNAVLEGE